ncbi:hypothetical protein ABW487_001618 [Haemophilus influenzae]
MFYYNSASNQAIKQSSNQAIKQASKQASKQATLIFSFHLSS